MKRYPKFNRTRFHHINIRPQQIKSLLFELEGLEMVPNLFDDRSGILQASDTVFRWVSDESNEYNNLTRGHLNTLPSHAWTPKLNNFRRRLKNQFGYLFNSALVAYKPTKIYEDVHLNGLVMVRTISNRPLKRRYVSRVIIPATNTDFIWIIEFMKLPANVKTHCVTSPTAIALTDINTVVVNGCPNDRYIVTFQRWYKIILPKRTKWLQDILHELHQSRQGSCEQYIRDTRKRDKHFKAAWQNRPSQHRRDHVDNKEMQEVDSDDVSQMLHEMIVNLSNISPILTDELSQIPADSDSDT